MARRILFEIFFQDLAFRTFNSRFGIRDFLFAIRHSRCFFRDGRVNLVLAYIIINSLIVLDAMMVIVDEFSLKILDLFG